jgi:arylsulfatase A-like enzyme
VDVVPSVLDLLGVPLEGSKLDGVPVFAIDAHGARPRVDERVQIAELLLAKRQIVRAVLLDDWKYLATWRAVDPLRRSEAREHAAVDLWGSPVHEEVYDLAGDPQERRNVITAEATVRDTLAGVLDKFRATGPNYAVAAGEAGEAAGANPISEADAAHLRALGYGE